jgi:SSS family solute:Na+ symporter
VAEGKGGWITELYEIRSGMGQAFIVASISWVFNFTTTILVSLATKPKPDEELKGLVYSLTKREPISKGRWYFNPITLGVLLLLATIALNIIFF